MLTSEYVKSKNAKIAIIGLGYVGLPLAVEFAHAGFKVLGVDNSKEKVEKINAGINYIKDVSDEILKTSVLKKILSATNDFSEIKTCDAVIICVPTPLNKHWEPDMSYIISAAEEVSKNLKHGALIVLESTTYPGTTDELLLNILEKNDKKLGKDFFLAFSPERVDPGNPNFKTKDIPKVVGGVDEQSTKIASELYSSIIVKVIPVTSARVAETTKLLENTFRTVNIGLINEIALMCQKMNIDIWEVIDAASTKPFGFMPFYPGPGLGGHCLPIDPLYLAWKAKFHNFDTRFINLAAEVNRGMPDFVVSLTGDALNQHKKAINGSKILILGIAYKNDIDDLRESPALNVIELLKAKGAIVSYYDPYIPSVNFEDIHISSCELSEDVLKKQDAVVVITAHKKVDYAFVVNNSSLVIDTRNVTKGIKAENIVKL